MKLSNFIDYRKLDIPDLPKSAIILDNQGFSQYPGPVIGIEVEVENYDHGSNCTEYGWSRDNDGSLRNHGMEFISRPTRPQHVETIINHLFNRLPDEVHFSPRTSIHVHMNCRDLTLKQVYNIVILHQCFEDLLYKFAGPERKKSIFCVPIGNSDYYLHLKHDANRSRLTNWSKYTSLNLTRIQDYGTIEFRHLRGTSNLNTIYTWLHLLYRLYNYAVSRDTEQLENEIKLASSTNNYSSFGLSVFGTYFFDLNRDNMYEKHMREDFAISKLFMADKLADQGVL